MKILKKIKGHFAAVKKTLNQIDVSGFARVTVFLDILYCHYRFHCTYDEYLMYQFYQYKNSYRKQFLLIAHHRKRYYYVNPRDYIRNKSEQNQMIQRGISRKMIVAPACGEEKFVAFFKDHGKIVTKPDYGSLGYNFQILHYEDEEQARNLFRNFRVNTLCEEYVVQHEALAALNPSSLNTIRIMTVCKNGEFEVLSATLKTGGKKDSIVDNMHNNGVGANVDIQTGITNTFGYNYKFQRFVDHPVTGIQMIGFRIPHWDQALNLVESLHKNIPDYILLGWDVAITPEGVEIIEVNVNPGPMLSQIMDKIPKGKTLLTYMKEAKRRRTR